MQVYVNEKYIADKGKMGRRASIAGLTILGIGMLGTFMPGWLGPTLMSTPLGQWYIRTGWMIVAFVSLLVGFLLGQYGNYNVRQFQRSPRADQVVAKAFKGLDDRNRLFAWSTPADLVFAGPSGIFAIVTRGISGNISVIDDKVRRPFNFLRILSWGQESGGTPAVEARVAASKLSEWLTKELGTADPILVSPLVVFTSDKAELDVQSSSAPILHHKKIKDYVRNQARPAGITRETLQAAISRLDEEAKRRGALIEE